MRKIIFLAAFSISLATYISAQRSSVQGQLFDSTDLNQPIIGATIRVFKNDTIQRVSTTELDGRFHLMLPAGTYVLEINTPEYIKTKVVNLVVDGQSTYYLHRNILLTPKQNIGMLTCGTYYRPPLYKKDVTQGGQELASYQIHPLSNNRGPMDTKRRSAAPDVIYIDFQDLFR